MRRGLYWLGVLVGVLLLAGGVVVAARGVSATRSPAGVVRGYLAALADSDAARALAYGTVPDGPHTLLTDAVLREQQRIAPMRDVSVGRTEHDGHTASVEAHYTLAFPGHGVEVDVRVGLHRASGDWRLDKVAIPTEISVAAARQRASILGGPIPDGSVLLFPGAVPLRLDTPYLRLDPSADYVSFDSVGADVLVDATAAGRTAVIRAVGAALRRCMSGPADPACPLPTERYVPGSIRGTLVGGLRSPDVIVDLTEPIGTLHVSGKVTVAGTWRRLTFHNRQITGSGRISFPVHAVAYATAPLRVRWVVG